MRRLLLLGTVVAVSTLLAGCDEPFIVLSGGALSGEVVSPPEDWSAMDDVEIVQLETRPEDPYSVNIWSVELGPDLYVATGEDGTNWTKILENDRDVRLRADGKIYLLRATPVVDPEERAAVAAAYVKKYGVDEDDNWVAVGQIFRLDRR
jgi:hypothetical protein